MKKSLIIMMALALGCLSSHHASASQKAAFDRACSIPAEEFSVTGDAMSTHGKMLGSPLIAARRIA